VPLKETAIVVLYVLSDTIQLSNFPLSESPEEVVWWGILWSILVIAQDFSLLKRVLATKDSTYNFKPIKSTKKSSALNGREGGCISQ
jgi:hypothetical protein